MPRRDDLLVALAALAPLLLFAARAWRIAGEAGFPLDDSWIHLQFARNLAEGAGFAYNPGTPVAGSTAPLWTLVLAAGAAVLGPSIPMVLGVGIGATLGAAVVTRRAALAFEAPRPVALLAAVGLLWTGPMTWGALSGMEVSLAALLVAAALLAHARSRLGWTALWGALAVVARPEALLLVPALACARPLGLRRALVFGVATAATVTPVVLFSLATAGAPFPATAAAKVEGGLIGWLGGLHEPAARLWLSRPWEFSLEWLGWLARTQWPLPLAVLPGAALAWVAGGRPLGAPALVLVAHPLGMALLAPFRGPAFQEGRYSIHLLPLAFVVLAAITGYVARLVGAPGRHVRGGPRWRPIVVAAYLATALAALVPAATRYGWAVQNINAMQVHLGRWVAAHLPPRARIAVNDIGAIAYFSRREIIDLMGLVTPSVIPYRRDGEAGIRRFLLETCPDYVIVFPTWFPGLAARRDLLEPVYRVRLQHNLVSGGSEMVVYRLARCTV